MKLSQVSAGHYWTDAGAFMGVLPYQIWHERVSTDERQRLRMELSLLLIQTESRNILVDTGIGNRLAKRRKEIYNPTEFELVPNLQALGLQASDITDVILTHLHFDHAGGVVSLIDDKDALTFPNAVYHIQSREWNMAKDPDKLNRAAYQFEHQLALLESDGQINLIEGTKEIAPNVFVHLVGGHSVGSQIIEILQDGVPYIYAGDIIPTHFHLPLAITSSYDVSRNETFLAKQMIYDKLIQGNGFLLLDHDTTQWQLSKDEILPYIAF
jgi:glyoxylase-like metal-dependent hydrolase (beta-lactamase superfamily II)